MSPRSSKPQPPAGNPSPDIYVGLLFVAVAALVAGCVFLALELNAYNWQVGV